MKNVCICFFAVFNLFGGTTHFNVQLLTSDGKLLATAAAQLKIFNCSDRKKMQKFSGHPVSSFDSYLHFQIGW